MFSGNLLNEINKYELMTIPKGAFILHEGEFCPGVPLVVDGTVKAIKEEMNSGKEIVLYRVESGEGCIMSITSSSLDIPIEASIVAETDVKLRIIPSKTSHQWSIYEDWTKFLLITTNQRCLDLIRLVHNVTFQSTGERLYNILLDKENLNGIILVKHEELANELGTAREVVSRLLKSLEKQKKVQLSRGEIKLL